ncbi:lanthionine synthetase LanC family protein [Streptomyces xanthophaeus]|uniref:lanthionine synthetase LanC family protein n=1 Tax=Streptomyces xanthophaeus TaxID=67385 RepID=UPI0034183ADD
MSHDTYRVRLHERWRFTAPTTDEESRIPALSGTRLPAGSAVLVSVAGGSQRVRILPAEVADPVGELAGRGTCALSEVDLPPAAIRALELDGTLRVTPRRPPSQEWRDQAAAEGSTSVAALRWAALFRQLTPDQLARRLYFFGRHPVTHRWLCRLPDEPSVSRWLGIGLLNLEADGLRPLPRTADTWVWRRWARPHEPASSKLYVCCLPADLPYALRECARTLHHPAVTGFKVGFDLPTILRPDKFVVFLSGPEHVEAVAADLVAAMGKIQVQPLPFTATADSGPLVAHASDPRTGKAAPPGRNARAGGSTSAGSRRKRSMRPRTSPWRSGPPPPWSAWPSPVSTPGPGPGRRPDMRLAEGPLVVAADLSIVPADELPATVRESLGTHYDAEGAALGRRASRSNATFVNRDVLALLDEFREPTTVVSAVIHYARRTQQPADLVLEESYQALTKLRRLGLLSAQQETEGAGPILRPGEGMGRWRVVRCLQSYEGEDTDVYLATDAANRTVVCKLARQPDSIELARNIRHEAAALRFLRTYGAPVPEPIETGCDGDGRPVLVMSHVDGTRIDQRAQVLRRTSEHRLLRACSATIDALRRIHAAGALHGDVHGGNYLLTADDTIVAIDFPYASSMRRPAARHGVPRLMDPQWARARLRGETEPSTPEAEQYSMAALIYFLLTGEHHYAPVSTETELLATLADGRLGDRFHTSGGPSLRTVLPVLERALQPEPSQRWPGLPEFSAAFDAAAEKYLAAVSRNSGDRQPTDRPDYTEYLTPAAFTQAPPPSSTALGTAGTAVTLLRASSQAEDPTLLAWADLWSDRALEGVPGHPDGGAWHGAIGALGARIAVSHALDDRQTLLETGQEYLREHDRYCTTTAPRDLTHGLASCLLWDAHLLPAVQAEPTGLLAAGASASALLCGALTRPSRQPGLAHGMCGHLLAVLAWHAASGQPLSTPVLVAARLDEIAESFRGGSGSPEQWCRPGWESSWCNGATGIALLFLTAADALQAPAYVHDAQLALRVALLGEPHGYDLCCGTAGRLYALRRMALATGEGDWRRRADREARDLHEGLTTLKRHGFAKGRAGALAVLGDDVFRESPDAAPGLPLIDAPRTDGSS